MKYRKKPVEIEAFVAGSDDIPDWFYDIALKNQIIMNTTVREKRENRWWCKIKTLEGVMTAYEGDFIIKGVKGEIYPCKPDIFNQTYEMVGEG